MSKIFHILILGVAILLPGAFVLLFLAMAKRYYQNRIARGKIVPVGIHEYMKKPKFSKRAKTNISKRARL